MGLRLLFLQTAALTTAAAPGLLLAQFWTLTQPLHPTPFSALKDKDKLPPEFLSQSPQSLLINPVLSAIHLEQPTDVSQMFPVSLSIQPFILSLQSHCNYKFSKFRVPNSCLPLALGVPLWFSWLLQLNFPLRVCLVLSIHVVPWSESPIASTLPATTPFSGAPPGLPPKE